MNRTYETMILLDNREVKKGWDTLKSEVTGLFTKHGSEVVSAKRWDERRLAYPIKGQQRATYLLMYHNAPTSSISGINRDLQYAEPVLRSLTLAVEEVPETAHEPEAEFDETAVPIDEDPVVEEPQADEAKAEEKSDADGEESKDDESKGEAGEAKAEDSGDAADDEKKDEEKTDE